MTSPVEQVTQILAGMSAVVADYASTFRDIASICRNHLPTSFGEDLGTKAHDADPDFLTLP